jgi:hypothetical protein
MIAFVCQKFKQALSGEGAHDDDDQDGSSVDDDDAVREVGSDDDDEDAKGRQDDDSEDAFEAADEDHDGFGKNAETPTRNYCGIFIRYMLCLHIEKHFTKVENCV